jgi:hypothetical protein
MRPGFIGWAGLDATWQKPDEDIEATRHEL